MGGVMAIRDKLRVNAAHVLQPGEVIQAVFSGTTTSPWFGLLVWIRGFRVVVVTDRRILVCRSGRTSGYLVKEVIRELPRNTRIGPARGLSFRCEVLGERLYIGKLFHKDIAEADAVIS
jgi:hypothetical protein